MTRDNIVYLDTPPVDYPRYARPIPVEHLGIVEGVDLYECLRANVAPRHRALALRAGSIFVVPSLRASITFAIMALCTLYAVKLAVIG